MRRIICDTCRTEAEPDSYGLAPTGWFSVSKRGDYAASKDYCSSPCVVQAYLPSAVQADAEPKGAVA